jgi:hypothetical protein
MAYFSTLIGPKGGDAFVQRHFSDNPTIVETYRNLTHVGMKPDLLRYLILDVEGGAPSPSAGSSTSHPHSTPAPPQHLLSIPCPQNLNILRLLLPTIRNHEHHLLRPPKHRQMYPRDVRDCAFPVILPHREAFDVGEILHVPRPERLETVRAHRVALERVDGVVEVKLLGTDKRCSP